MPHLTDNEFEQQFADCTLDPGTFSHVSHVRLAWIHLRKYGVEQAIENLNIQIARYDSVHGDGTKFHVTLTVASAYIIDHFVRQSSATEFDDFIREFPKLATAFRALIAQHYSAQCLSSREAKTEFVEPDVLPFA